MKTNTKQLLMWIILICLLLIIVSFCIYIITSNLQNTETLQNKTAIHEYINNNYPNAVILSENYETSKFKYTTNAMDSVFCEYDGIRFAIIADSGIVIEDGYQKSVSNNFIYTEYLKDFTEARQITPEISIHYMGSEPNDNLKEYDGTILLTLVTNCKDPSIIPNDIDWLYEFYKHWKKVCDAPYYIVTINIIYPNNTLYTIHWESGSVYENKNDFYAAFRYIEG